VAQKSEMARATNAMLRVFITPIMIVERRCGAGDVSGVKLVEDLWFHTFFGAG
jgi:hypothetical protein